MRYLSPASLQTGPLDTKALQLQRKKLLAELELNGDGSELRIKDRPFSKSEILEFFESLQDETTLRYHEAISKDPVLVDFLEIGTLPAEATFAPSDLYQQEGFRQWISHYFYTAFTDYVYRCFENTDEPALKTIMENPLLLTDYDREQAWVRVAQMLEDNVAQLEYYCNQDPMKPTLQIADISILITDPLMRMILLFPQEPLTTVRNKYAFYIMQVCIHIFNRHKHHRDYIDGWMEIGIRIAATEEVKEQLEAKHQEMKTIRDKTGRNRLIRFSVILVIILSKFMCNSNHAFH